MNWRLFAALAVMFFWTAPGHAAWLEASSPHFVVYADDSEKDLRRFADQLERYHAAMSFLTKGGEDAPSPSNRVVVFVVKSGSEVRKLMAGENKFAQGFYQSRAGRSIAVVSTITPGSGKMLDFSMITLLHEYAHHFLISTSAYPQPRWLSEGSAEFYSSASFFLDGSVGIGQPAYHRSAELTQALKVTAEDLLDPDAYARRGYKQYDEFYGKSWLLYHYLYWNKARGAELHEYFDLLMHGKTQREAALEAFGPFDVLDEELGSYLNKGRFMTYKLPASDLTVGAISIRPLTAGEAAIMPVRIRSSAGVNEEQAKLVQTQARAIAALYPKDAAVLTALAEAEYDAGDAAAAIVAADAALALDPGQVNAYVQKGMAMFRLAADAKDPDAAFRAARAPFLALNRIEPDHPLPLIWYYRSFLEIGDRPSPAAVEGLKRAVELAPFDLGLRMTLVTQELRDQRPEQARLNLQPVAFDPHGKGYAKVAQEMLARLDANPKWDGTGFSVPDAKQDDEPE